MSRDGAGLAEFLSLSSTLTGFSGFHLRGTGQAAEYYRTTRAIVGDATVAELLGAYARLVDETEGNAEAMDRSLRRNVLEDDKLGPVARNLIKLWYTGMWYQLPAAWCESYGASEDDRTFVLSPASYTEGLLWPAIGANPPGAKPFGYGIWAEPPRIESVQQET